MFHNNKEQTAEIYQKMTLCIIEVYKCLHFIDPDVDSQCAGNIQDLIIKSLETLNFLMNIKGFPNFDC